MSQEYGLQPRFPGGVDAFILYFDITLVNGKIICLFHRKQKDKEHFGRAPCLFKIYIRIGLCLLYHSIPVYCKRFLEILIDFKKKLLKICYIDNKNIRG